MFTYAINYVSANSSTRADKDQTAFQKTMYILFPIAEAEASSFQEAPHSVLFFIKPWALTLFSVVLCTYLALFCGGGTLLMIHLNAHTSAYDIEPVRFLVLCWRSSICS